MRFWDFLMFYTFFRQAEARRAAGVKSRKGRILFLILAYIFCSFLGFIAIIGNLKTLELLVTIFHYGIIILFVLTLFRKRGKRK